MRPDCQLQAFNAKVTVSPRITPPPYPHSCPSVLVLLFRTTGRAVFEGVLLSPSVTLVGRGQDGPRRCLPAVWAFLVHLERFFFLGVGLGLDMKWAGLAKSFGPTLRYMIEINNHISINEIVGVGGGGDIYMFGNLRIRQISFNRLILYSLLREKKSKIEREFLLLLEIL